MLGFATTGLREGFSIDLNSPFPNSPISFVRQAERLFRDPMVQDQGICFVYDVSLLTGRADYEVLRLIF